MAHMMTRSPLGYQPEEQGPPHRAENITNLQLLEQTSDATSI